MIHLTRNLVNLFDRFVSVSRNTCYVLRVDVLRIPFDDSRDTSSQVFVKVISIAQVCWFMFCNHVSRHVSETWTTA